MKSRSTFGKILGIVLLTQLWSNVTGNREIACEDLKKGNVFEKLIYYSGSSKPKNFTVDFYIATRTNRNDTRIDINEIETLENSGFDPSLKTIVLFHGYKSSGRKSWILELKEKLLDAVDNNVIIVDWSRGSNFSVYVNAARHTLLAANKTFDFLQELRTKVEELDGSSKEFMWNHLYFIGHSLGAHVSGQIASLLKKKDPFWIVERITGLDPAKPCFTEIDSAWRLDEGDAQFVDIIHTQIGTDKRSLGLGERSGHVDFYVNGGVLQPECRKTFTDYFTSNLHKAICSHKLAYTYFSNAVAEIANGGCSFLSYSWDGTYEDASKILKERINNVRCDDCPEIGLDTPKSPKRGMFLVITTEAKPLCLLDSSQYNFSRVAKAIGRLKKARAILTRGKCIFKQ